MTDYIIQKQERGEPLTEWDLRGIPPETQEAMRDHVGVWGYGATTWLADWLLSGNIDKFGVDLSERVQP